MRRKEGLGAHSACERLLSVRCPSILERAGAAQTPGRTPSQPLLSPGRRGARADRARVRGGGLESAGCAAGCCPPRQRRRLRRRNGSRQPAVAVHGELPFASRVAFQPVPTNGNASQTSGGCRHICRRCRRSRPPRDPHHRRLSGSSHGVANGEDAVAVRCATCSLRGSRRSGGQRRWVADGPCHALLCTWRPVDHPRRLLHPQVHLARHRPRWVGGVCRVVACCGRASTSTFVAVY